MAVGDLLTGDGQAEVRELLIARPNYDVIGWTMFADPDSIVSDSPRPGGGIVTGGDSDGAVQYQLRLNLRGTVMTSLANLKAAFQRSSDEVQLAFQTGGQKRMMFGRTRGADTTSAFALPTVCDFTATTPRQFSCTEGSATPGTDPTISVAGIGPTIWQWTRVGPDASPELVIGGVTYTFGPIASGHTLTVSQRRGRVTDNGAPKIGLAASEGKTPPVFKPLPTGTVSIDGTGGTLIWRDRLG